MSQALVHRFTHLHITTRLGRAVTYIDGPTVVEVLLDIRPATQNPNAPPLDLRLVIDRSGSMRDDGKLDAVKAAMLAVVDDLDSKDRLTIVTFDATHKIDLSATQMNWLGKRRARAAIKGLQAEGSTFISGAFDLAITRPDPNFETRIVLFTDGESTINSERDHANLMRDSDHARGHELPVFIYGTGEDYNFSLLQQIAARVGHGSFLKHVMDAEVLRDHLRSEIGFLRGVGVRGLTVHGHVPQEAVLVAVTRFMPEQSSVTLQGDDFDDLSGALDRARGQLYLIKLTVDAPVPGTMKILELELSGKDTASHNHPFKEKIDIQATFTSDITEQSPIDDEVRKVLLRMIATKKAEQGDFDGAADMYTRAGDPTTANVMHTMSKQVRNGSRTQNETVRGATSASRGSVIVERTINRPIDKKVDP